VQLEHTAGEGTYLGHLAAHAPADGAPGLTTAGYRLPDADLEADQPLRWAPGALAGILGRHTLLSATDAHHPGDLLVLIRRCRRTAPGSGRVWSRLYDLAVTLGSSVDSDEIVRKLGQDHSAGSWQRRKRAEWTAGRDHATAQWLAFAGRHRGAVELGIALLGLGLDAGDRERLLILARHDALSGRVLSALLAAGEDREKAAYDVARSANGWGRVAGISRLRQAWHSQRNAPIPRTPDPDIQRWLICGGYRTRGLDDYTAMDAAESGMLDMLRAAVAAPGVRDQELVDSAARVLLVLTEAALDGGPSGTIADYTDAAEALQLVFVLAGSHEPSMHLCRLAQRTRQWLLLSPDDDIGDPPSDISDVDCERIAALAAEIRARWDWSSLAVQVLAEPAHPDFGLAEGIAASSGYDTFPALLNHLDHGGSHWKLAAQRAGTSRIGTVVERAELALSPAGLGGSRPSVYLVTTSVLGELDGNDPGRGWQLVKAALDSGGQERWFAYNALKRWGRGNWPTEAEPTLRSALSKLTDVQERRTVQQMLDPDDE
jgi:hypothetical protein